MNVENVGEIRALVLDDNTFARKFAVRALTSAGVAAVVEAASGSEAISILSRATNAVHLIFCDLLMPDMDGVEFVRHAATLAIVPTFVFVSGADQALLNTAEDMARARGLEVLGSIQKPISVDAVRRILTKLHDAAPQSHDAGRASITPAHIEDALNKKQILLHFQPKVSLTDGALVGFEALARWQHPDFGLIPPGAFITLAEESGQIAALTDYLAVLAMEQCAAWNHVGLHAKISVNLSAYMLVDLDLPDRMEMTTRRVDIRPGQIVLEITESGLFRDAATALDILARLHMKGFPLSIDDFGTGYSSMEQLRRVPFSEMKIDRAFVRGAAESSRARMILKSSADLGRNLGMSVVAEGAETIEDWKTLGDTGVDIVQGYFVAKPMAVEQVESWWRRVGDRRLGLA